MSKKGGKYGRQRNLHCTKDAKRLLSQTNYKSRRTKKLDRKVKKSAEITAYCLGVVFALILGVGMCLAMQVIGGTIAWLAVGVVVGVIGLVFCALNYLFYQKIVQSRKKKYADQILKLSNVILNQD